MRGRSFSQYVLKVHSRCDLSCDHCYIYEHADQTWRHRPRIMSPEIVQAAADRIAEHAAAHRLPSVHVVLHGGEPLLLGRAGLARMIADLRAAIVPVTRLDLRMQTNGLLLTREIADLLAREQVMVGVSLDGDRTANDRHRRFASGASSHRQVLRALALLREPAYRSAYAGILCTVDVRNDPDRVYAALLAERPPRIDLLLPHATWDRPPPRPGASPTPYADWLYRIYRRWTADGRPVPIRLFDSLLATAAGLPSETEAVGLEPADLLVIETDGFWEQADSLKTAFDGAPATGSHVLRHGVDEAGRHSGLLARAGGVARLSATCRACPVVRRCGGGLYAHRYRTGTGFANPSVYCADLKEFIRLMDRHAEGSATGRSESATEAGRPLPPAVSGLPPSSPALAGRLTSPVDRGPISPSVDFVDDLATGYGDPTTVARLQASQLSITRMLLAALADGAPADGATAEAWALLDRLESAAPKAVGAVLAYPFVRPWLARRLLDGVPRHRLRTGGDERASESAGTTAAGVVPDDGRLAALVAAVAVRAGLPLDITVPAGDGVIVLPTVGRLALDATLTNPVLSVTDTGFTVQCGGVRRVIDPARQDRSIGWQPVRRVVDDGLDVAIEDLDPERDCYAWPVSPVLDDVAARSWQRDLAAAWSAVRRDTPAHASALRQALRSVVPLRPDPSGREHSATARDAFGAVALPPTNDPDALAVLLVHEWQHVKLGAALDVCRMVEPGYRHRLVVPWRPDPRPVEGVLQGTYAHLGIAQLWRARAGDAGPGRRRAGEMFERYLRWTADAADALLGTGALTEDGARFVSGIKTAAADARRSTRV